MAKTLVCLSEDVNSANIITIKHCPIAKQNSNPIENKILLDIVANAIMLANIGDEQGLEAKAKNVPTKKGKTNILPVLFCGIFFTIAGKCSSKIPTKFNPNINMTDANSKITTGDAKFVNARPVIAQMTPIILSTIDKPMENDNICKNNFLLFSLEYPPTYPIIKGNIPKLQGDKEAKIPAKNATTNKIGSKKLLPAEYTENA